MAEKNRGLSRELLIHPGETISDVLEERGLTQKELAKRAGVSDAFLSKVIHGEKDVSKALAIGLEYALDIPCSFWLNLQANYDAELLAIQEEETVQDNEKDVFRRIHEVVAYLTDCRVVSAESTIEQKIIAMRKYFQLSNLTKLNAFVPDGAFRISDKTTVDLYVLGAWLCLCKAQFDNSHPTSVFERGKVFQLVSEIKKIMNKKDNHLEPLKELLSQHGISLSIVRNFRGAPVHGYIVRRENNTYQMFLTLRGCFADIFWFSLFHELGHIANGDLSRPGSFIDVNNSQDYHKEIAADRFAAECLLESESYWAFVNNHVYTYSAIESYAKSQGVPAYIVIGRLQKEKLIPWDRFTRYKPRYKWAEV